MKILDTTFLVDLVRGRREETLKVTKSKEVLVTTHINMYEIIKGLFLGNVSPSKIIEVLEMFEDIRILSLDNNSIIKSAEISSNLIKNGNEISDFDCMTAGIALSNGVNNIITRNKEHFGRIKGIKVESY